VSVLGTDCRRSGDEQAEIDKMSAEATKSLADFDPSLDPDTLASPAPLSDNNI